ncbi:MAG TPA: hypothetical protein VJZ91_06265 [Blastocatellia bacterium]|nr:hypothetical protein [Blastocatellia bacterium]
MATKTDEPDTSSEALSPEQIAREKLKRMIKERGIKPMTIGRLRSMGDLWPEDEEVDEFLAAVREWRSEGTERREP